MKDFKYQTAATMMLDDEEKKKLDTVIERMWGSDADELSPVFMLAVAQRIIDFVCAQAARDLEEESV